MGYKRRQKSFKRSRHTKGFKRHMVFLFNQRINNSTKNLNIDL